MAEKFALLAIRKGEVRGMCGIVEDAALKECVSEWALDPTVDCMIRVPIEIARKSFDATEQQVREWLKEMADAPA
ncbi:hypothetical protein VW35_01035 [Devosia soli]|uniref:Uncharacterized protein n=1 Tax=Devosia soli TaxID=361041 RepID=A0A0F5LF49_9HYPH|nr:hypothetical protein [Devosia soli]KKB80824.1 hypothetical protein VW35_01035 [Devosia soli]